MVRGVTNKERATVSWLCPFVPPLTGSLGDTSCAATGSILWRVLRDAREEKVIDDRSLSTHEENMHSCIHQARDPLFFFFIF